MLFVPCFLGVDPGVSGGMVALCGQTVCSTSLEKMDRYDIRNWIEDKALNWSDGGIYACIEKVGGFIGGTGKQGERKNVSAAHKAFTFGESFGWLSMALVSARITHRMILPKVWQKALGIKPRKKGESKPSFKGRMKKLAQVRYPEEKVTLATSDALLLATYCKSLKWY